MNITDKKKTKKIMNKQLKYIKCEPSRRELWESQFTFFHCKLYNDFFFSLPKAVNLTVFYSKITLNVP